MAERLTDEKKKMIIAHYAESGSYKATAKCFGGQTILRTEYAGASRKYRRKSRKKGREYG